MSIALTTGVLVVIEGIDGAGKTTQARLLAETLTGAGFDVVSTKEPTDRSEHGRRIRASAIGGRLSLTEELHAFLEDRREHVRTLIAPALAAGKIVIVDRYYFSSVAYQGARGATVETVLRRNEAFAPAPDLLLHLAVDATVGIDRIRARGDIANDFEREEDLRRCAVIFAEMDFPYLLRLDGRLPIQDIARTVLERLWTGPLRQRICSDGRTTCEPAYCVQVKSCPHPGLWRTLGLADPSDDSTLADVQGIVDDTSLTEIQRRDAILKRILHPTEKA